MLSNYNYKNIISFTVFKRFIPTVEILKDLWEPQIKQHTMTIVEEGVCDCSPSCVMEKPHFQGWIRVDPDHPNLTIQQVIKQLRNRIHTHKLSIKYKTQKHEKTGYSISNNWRHSKFGLGTAQDHWENYYTYICKGICKQKSSNQIFHLSGNYTKESKQKLYEVYWSNQNLKNAKKKVLKEKTTKDTIGESYFKFMELIPPDDIKYIQQIDTATSIFFAQRKKRGDFNTIIGYSNSWVAHKHPRTKLHTDIMLKIQEIRGLRII